MVRDEFSPKTKSLLGEASGFNCVRPGCGKPTKAFDQVSQLMKNISVSAHDSAASPGGPRYDDSLTPEQRRANHNGAWLCPTCARLVDVDVERFPPGTISSWQLQASEYRRNRMHSPVAPMGVNFRDACISAKEFISLCRRIQHYRLSKTAYFETIESIKYINRNMHPFDAANSLCTQFPHMVNIQKQILEALNSIQDEMEYSGNWWRNNEFKYYELLKKHSLFPTPDEININDRIERSYQLMDERFNDFHILLGDLNSIAMSSSPPMDLYSW